MTSGSLALVKLVAFLTVLLSAIRVQARPANPDGVLAFTGPTSVQTTTHTTDSNGNPVLQVCTVQLTPVTINGEDDVIAVSTCVQTPDTDGGGGGNTTTPAGTTITTTSSPSVDTSLSTATPPGDTSSPTIMLTTTTPTPTNGGAINLGTSSLTAPPSLTTTTTSTTITLPTTKPTGTEAPASAAGAVNTGLPGKSISVLPIGLGVFAGLSVIAMIVVGGVTYERTKYRKKFRTQKLADAGGAIGYGGMAQARV